MEMKTISDCLSAIDFAVVENVKLLAIQDSENIHNRCLEIGMNDYIENRIELEKVLKYIICIIDNYPCYEYHESLYNEYLELPKLIVIWLIERNIKPEIDNNE